MRHGISWDVHGNDGKGAPLNVARALPDDIAAGINLPTLHDQVRDGPIQTLELRTAWNKPAAREYAFTTVALMWDFGELTPSMLYGKSGQARRDRQRDV